MKHKAFKRPKTNEEVEAFFAEMKERVRKMREEQSKDNKKK